MSTTHRISQPPRISNIFSINTLLYVALILALAASLRHVAFAFASTNGGNWFEAYISAVAIDLGLLALAAGIASRARVRRATWPLWAGVALFSLISVYANWLAGLVHVAPIEVTGLSRLGQGLVNLRPILLSAVLPVLVIYLSEIVSGDHSVAQAAAERLAKREAQRATILPHEPHGRAFEPGDPEALAQANEAKQAGIEARRAQVAELSDQDMTQSEIAQALGVSRSTIKRDLAAVHNGHINGHSQ